MTSGKAYKLLNDLIDKKPDCEEIFISKDISTRLGKITVYRDKKIIVESSVPKRTMYALNVEYGEG